MYLEFILFPSLYLNSPESNSRIHLSAGTTFPFMQITIDPALQTDVAAMAQPKLNDASESMNLSGFVDPVNAITAELLSIRFCT